MHKKKRSELVRVISKLVESVSDQQKRELFDLVLNKKEEFPVSIFNSKLSGLSSMVVYLIDSKNKTAKETSEILNRNRSTIYTTYQKAKKKLSGRLDDSNYSITISPKIFTDRNFSILESLVYYLKNDQKLSFAKISRLLNKNYSTVRTVYMRYKKKDESR